MPAINLEKRKRIMKRSIKLGHCICDPHKPCPCQLFKEKDICLCAGEKLEQAQDKNATRLTELIEKPGCASKIDRATLYRTLAQLEPVSDPNVIVGFPAGDDAGIYKISEKQALVQTVDVFTPSTDDPFTFGQIAAANSLSDVYAMGGKPLTALSIIGFPVNKIPDSALTQILKGGLDIMRQANVPVIGGHSINDADVKAGFAVTGLIELDKIITNKNAQPHDLLILTKPIGTGIIAFAKQINRAPVGSAEAINTSMTTLNKAAAEIMLDFDVHACTDVTGFSLAGHLCQMAQASAVDVSIVWDDIPIFDGILQCLAEEIIPGAAERNKESFAYALEPDSDLPQPAIDLCFDAQTSGGLLIAADQKQADNLIRKLHSAGCPHAAIIGRVTSKGTGKIKLTTNSKRKIPENQQKQ